MARAKLKHTAKNTIVLDVATGQFIQKEHIVHGKKVLDYPIAQCKNCGEDYPKKRVDQEFCKPSCRKAWHRKQYYDGNEPDLSPRQCLICNTIFTPTRPWSKYDTDECRVEARRRKLEEMRGAVSELSSASVK